MPRLDSEVKCSSGKRRLPDSAALALAALDEALDDLGEIPPASNYIPRGTKAVTLKQWQDYAERRSGGDIGDRSSSERKAFLRAKAKLQKIIAIWGTYVWKM